MTVHTQDVFDPSAYPHTYGLSVAGKWLVSVLGLLMASSSLAGAIFFWLKDEGRTPGGLAMLMTLCAGLALMGLYLLAVAVFYRVILQADSIEVFEIYRRRYLLRHEIEGRGHFSYRQGMSAWLLVPKPGFGGKIKLSTPLKTDKAYLSWIHSLPDLDLEKKRAADRERTEAVASIKEQGFSELTLRRVASGLTVAVYVMGFVSFLLRDPDHVLTWLLLALPWVGIFLVAKFAPFYRFGGPRNSPLPDLSLVLIGPGLFFGIGRIAKHRPDWLGEAFANCGARKRHAGRRCVLV